MLSWYSHQIFLLIRLYIYVIVLVMTEREHYTPENPDDEPSIGLTVGSGVEVSLMRTNSAMYSYLGSLAMYNHVYFVGDDKVSPFYLFREFTPRPQFNKLTEAMIRYKFPHFDNQTWIGGVDIDAFDAHTANLSDQLVDELFGEKLPEDQE